MCRPERRPARRTGLRGAPRSPPDDAFKALILKAARIPLFAARKAC
jgi:hypothetical protein